MEVTSIKTQTKNPNRASLYVDGKFYRGIDKLVAMKLGLRVGLTLTPAIIDRLEKQESSHNVWEYALRLMEASPKNSHRMYERLKTKFDEAVAQATVKKLIDAKIIDDQRLADSIVERLTQQESKSIRQIKLYLMTKKFSPKVIESSLKKITENYDKQSALNSARHKYRQLKNESWQTKSQKIYAYLARQGFDYDIIKQTVTKEKLDVNI
ncbi:hypothetical protein DRH29_01210 [candidate division Kazan bacterium]|uniref:Regulatory protein RecX n=1 Tax=candidate division Kazan bacterium TaxID=2202143 RepID=A0A420ZDH2_UNCK3|nr:MAG: hypothetical protein DRH29_01210 [candidate division Kazan bacterium]